MGKSKFSAEEKYQLLRSFKASGMSGDEFGRRHHISRASLIQWQDLYNREGIEGLRVNQSTKQYSLETKLGALAAYLNGEGTLRDVSVEYGIVSESSLRKWLIDYHRGKPLAEFGLRKQEPSMANKITFEDRLRVVNYVNDGHNYKQAATQFNVSYQQARLWTLKFNNDGIEALKDNRGHHQSSKDDPEVDALKQEIRDLKKKVYDQETIIQFQKKLKELQQRE